MFAAAILCLVSGAFTNASAQAPVSAGTQAAFEPRGLLHDDFDGLIRTFSSVTNTSRYGTAEFAEMPKPRNRSIVVSSLSADSAQLWNLAGAHANRGGIHAPGLEPYSLLADDPNPEFFLYDYPHHVRWKRPADDDQILPLESKFKPRPLLRLKIGNWRLPIVVRDAAASNLGARSR